MISNNQKKGIDLQLIKLIWTFASPYKLLLIFSIAILITSKTLLTLIPLGIKFAIDMIQNQNFNLSLFQFQFQLGHVALALFLLYSFHFLTSYLQILQANSFGQKVIQDLRTHLFSHILKQSHQFFVKNQVGQLITRIIHDVQALNELFVSSLPTILGDTFLIILIFSISFALDFRLALVSFITIPILFYGLFLFKKYSRKYFFKIRTYLAQMNSFTQNILSGISTIKIFNRQNHSIRQFKSIHHHYFQEYIKIVKLYSIYFPAIEILSILSKILILLFGSYWTITQQIPLSNMIAFLFYSPMLFQPIRELSEQFNTLQSALASSERISQILSTHEYILSSPTPQSSNQSIVQGSIQFDQVCFEYHKNQPILKNISFSVQKGNPVAIVGPSGSGKTTITQLISRFYDLKPLQGQILIDQTNIKNIPLDTLRKNITYISQNIFLFSSSIKDNIRLFDPSISDQKIVQASIEAQAHSFIVKLKNQYDTQLGELGIGLSTGQKQLIAFARALAHDSKIIIFDEATSHIDPHTESLIQYNIQNTLKKSTSIIIAHRLASIKNVQNILVLHQGSIQETGTHHQLLKQRSLYYQLYQYQSKSIV